MTISKNRKICLTLTVASSFCLLTGISVMYGMILDVIVPYGRTSEFIPADCMVNSVTRILPDQLCVCQPAITGRHRGVPCESSYVCYNVQVEVKDATEGFEGNATLRVAPWMITYYQAHLDYTETGDYSIQPCTYIPAHCLRDPEENRKEIETWLEEWGVLGKRLICYYDSENPDNVLLSVSTYTDYVHAVVWPFVFMLVGLILLIPCCIVMRREAE